MWYNLKIAIRNLKYNKLYSWINIIGLAVGLTACILITLWIQNELSYDRFHKHAKQIFRVNADMDDMGIWESTPVQIARLAEENSPEVIEACREGYYDVEYAEYNNKKYFDIRISAVDNNFFTFFDFPLIQGNEKNPFHDDLSLIISESKAKIFFGEENPIGKIIKFSDGLLFHIVGVCKDVPENSSLQFDFVVPRIALQRTFMGNGSWKHIDDDWGNYRYQTFLYLHDKDDAETVAQKLSDMVTALRNTDLEEDEEVDVYTFILQPLTKMHLHNPENEGLEGIKTIYLLSIIAAFILVIACMNYVNLITARATKRIKEISIRKILGADKKTLFFQLIRETLVLLFLAFFFATAFIYFLIPLYNNLIGKDLNFSFTNPSVCLVYGIMIILTLLLSGLYPALSLISFQPANALKGHLTGKKKGAYTRKVLVILQFAISFVLIVTTIGLNSQIRYMRKKDLGYDQENIFTVPTMKMGNHYDVVKDELLKSDAVLEVSGAAHNNMNIVSWRRGVFWQGKSDDFDPPVCRTNVKPDFFELMDIELVAGETFQPQDSFRILINEEAARIMNMSDPVGQLFYMNKGDEQAYTIKGVVKNFNFQMLNQKINPLIIDHARRHVGVLYVKAKPNETQAALAAAEKIWKQYNPDYDFVYSFLDENFNLFYKSEIYMQRLLFLFSIIAIFISCIGLFGLITYTAESKTKEIGIRKVLGSSIKNIVYLLSKEFLILVTISILIAFPLVYWWLNTMLQDYAYRIPLSWPLFASGILITVGLTLLSVGFQAFKAAKANPVDAIKTE